MRRPAGVAWWCVVAVLAALLLPAAMAASAAAVDEGVVAFVDVDVLPMDHDVLLPRQTVLVRDGVIAEVGPSTDVAVPEGARRIDGRGKVLMPGLAEMHGHLPGGDDTQYVEDVLFLYLSNGVTLVRNMAGSPSHPQWRDRIARGEVAGPTLVVASPWLRGDDIDDLQATLRAHAEAGYDLVKIGSMPPALYPDMARAAHALGLPFAGHVPAGVTLERVLEMRQASIDHFDSYVQFLVPEDSQLRARDAGFFGSAWIDGVDRGRIAAAVQGTVAAGVWNVPTLSLVEHLASPESAQDMVRWPEMRYMPPAVLDGWVRAKQEFAGREDFQPAAAQRFVQLRRDLLKALHDAGAPIALGSDAPQFFNVPGFSIHHEMRMMVAAGLTPYEVLVTGTRAPARYLGTPDAFGTVAPGRRADLILVEGDPRGDIERLRNPAGVMLRGQWWPAERISERLEAIAARRASAASQ